MLACVSHIHPSKAKVKSQEQQEAIYHTLSQNTLFHDISSKHMRALIDSMWAKDVPAGRCIMKEGDLGDNVFILDKGNMVTPRTTLIPHKHINTLQYMYQHTHRHSHQHSSHTSSTHTSTHTSTHINTHINTHMNTHINTHHQHTHQHS
jgi:hypothetical protein